MADHFHYMCSTCGKSFKANGVIYLCPDCSPRNTGTEPIKGVLKVVYPYNIIREQYGEGLWSKLKSDGYLPLLPIRSLQSLSILRVGNTPLYRIENLTSKKDHFNLYLKDDSQNPTFSFKDRASNLVSAFAREHDIQRIAAASTGNAGSSLAGICASQGQKAIIFAPASAPLAKLTQILMYGASLVPVEGTYDEAFELCLEASKRMNWYNRNTAYNPLTIEGKKTAAFELYDQLGQAVPDRIFIPAGDGVILSGVYKGFEELLLLGLIRKIPEIVAVQAEGSGNLVNNLNSTGFRYKKSVTIADSISVDIPRNFLMAVHYLHHYQGKGLLVSDEEILRASEQVASESGIFCEPAAAAAYAGMLRFRNSGQIEPGSDNVVLLTGSGLKDLQAVQSRVTIPQSVKPDIGSFMKLINKNLI